MKTQRPKSQPKERLTRARIISVAHATHIERGHVPFRLATLAGSLGVTSNALKRYVANESEVTRECLAESMATLDLLLDNLPGESAPPRLRSVIERRWDQTKARRSPGAGVVAPLSAFRGCESSELRHVLVERIRRCLFYADPYEDVATLRATLTLALLDDVDGLSNARAKADLQTSATRLAQLLTDGLRAPGLPHDGWFTTWLQPPPLRPPLDSKTRLSCAYRRVQSTRPMSGVTVDALLAEAGISRETLYRNFRGGMDEIGNIASQDSIHLASGCFDDDPKKAPTERLVRCITRLCSYRSRGVLLVSSDIPAHHPIQVNYVRLRSRIESLIVGCQVAGEVRPCDPSLAAHMILAAVSGARDLDGDARVGTYVWLLFTGLLNFEAMKDVRILELLRAQGHFS